MKVPTNAAVTVGTFDGVHIGHRRLIQSTVDFAKKTGVKSCVIAINNQSKKLTPTDVQNEILHEMGVEIVVSQDFTDDFKNLVPTDFFEIYLKNCKYIVVGVDFKFGRSRLGDVELLRSLAKNAIVNVIPPVTTDGLTVSSSAIRSAIYEGDFQLAEKMLGRSYAVGGIVQRGDQIGKQLGFPTVNIAVKEHMVLPPKGVYVCQTEYNGEMYDSITNYGGKPTVKDSLDMIETHLLNFDREIYGEKIAVRFVEKIRDIKTFSSKDELIIQLNKDKIKIIEKNI